MRTRIAKLPQNLQNIDKDMLDYIEDWACARVIHTKKTSKIYFISKNEKTLNFPKENKEVSVCSHITITLPAEYAKANEEIFNKGIKATAKQLAYDGFFEEALKVIPTTFYVFENDFVLNFTFHYQMGLKKFKLPKETSKQYDDLRADTIKDQRILWRDYKKCKSKYIEWNKAHNTEKSPV